MGNLSECLTCSEGPVPGYDKEVSSIATRNAPLGSQNNRNGTIQYITEVDISVAKAGFKKFYKPNPLCDNDPPLDKTKFPNKVRLRILDEKLLNILSNINVLNRDEKINGFGEPFDDTIFTKKLSELITGEIDCEDLFDNIVENPSSLNHSLNSFMCNIVTLKPENWDFEPKGTQFFVHENDNRKTKKTCRGGKPQVVNNTGYNRGQMSMRVGGKQVWLCENNIAGIGSRLLPPEPELQRDVYINHGFGEGEQEQEEQILWKLGIVANNVLYSPDFLSTRNSNQLLSCNLGSSAQADNFKKYNKIISNIKRKFNKNDAFLCRLIQYLESKASPEIPCAVEFLHNDKEVFSSARQDLRVYLEVGFAQDQDPNFTDFDTMLTISLSISDEAIPDPDPLDFADDNNVYFINFSCPESIILKDIKDIKDYVTVNVVSKLPENRSLKITFNNNRIISQDYPYCINETQNLPTGKDLQDLDLSNSKVKNLYLDFVNQAQKGLICYKYPPDDKNLHALFNNVDLKDYKSYADDDALGQATFYSGLVYSIEERDFEGQKQLVIFNKNKGTVIDCLEGQFFESSPETNESLLANKFFDDYDINKNTNIKPVYDVNGKAYTAKEHIFKTVNLKVPIFLLQTKNNVSKFVLTTFNHTFSVPFKSKLTDNKVLVTDNVFEEIVLKGNFGGKGSLLRNIPVDSGGVIRPLLPNFIDLENVETLDYLWYDYTKYKQMLPFVINANKKRLIQLAGPNFEYLPVDSSYFNKQFSENRQTVFVFTNDRYDRMNDTSLPCIRKVRAAIDQLKPLYERSVVRYHGPLFDFVSNIAVIGSDDEIKVNVLNERVTFTPSLAKRNYYRQVLSSGRTGRNFSTLTSVSHIKETSNSRSIEGNPDSLIQQIYTTANSEVYIQRINTYNEKAPVLAAGIKLNQPVDYNINDFSDLEKMLKNTKDEQLALPGIYFSMIRKLQDIITEEKYREDCGPSILGEGE